MVRLIEFTEDRRLAPGSRRLRGDHETNGWDAVRKMCICCVIFIQITVHILCLCQTETDFVSVITLKVLKSFMPAMWKTNENTGVLSKWWYKEKNHFHLALKLVLCCEKAAGVMLLNQKTFTHATHESVLSVYLTSEQCQNNKSSKAHGVSLARWTALWLNSTCITSKDWNESLSSL